ncbi:hypothetical protein PR202_gb26358 [Eleusine coracana subsp. coracana]|uniref:Uncharacterized protein n=1 Tax=Eleusine coracana subsp. coracana TaxID=191504 RepID=A0AAV5FRY4_ELECO|nr:hypothetical protein PR202_gb26358 [Eleusine coracana subsp. coracana]
MIKSRKILRDDRGHHQRPRRRPSSPPATVSPALPKGIVHQTTNLEMVASLAGNIPEQQQKKSLLAVPVGIKNKNVVDKLVSKFPASDFTVMLFHYDGAVEQWGDEFDRAVHVAAKGQTKLWFAKRFLHPDVVDDYDYVFLWDEDIEVDAFDPVRYLAVVRREGLEVSQPALDRASEIHHAHTARRLAAGPNNPEPTDVHRAAAGWMEVMVPVLSRKAWRCAWGMLQNDLIHGWGLHYKLGYCAGGDRARNVGVVDSEYVLHRGVPVLGGGGGNSAGRAAVRRRSFKEMQIFQKRWNAAVAEDQDWTDPYAAQAPAAVS